MGRAAVEERPLTLAELRPLFAGRWPDVDPAALGWAFHYRTPLVQVPPRGLWRRSGLPKCTTAEHWLGRPLEGEPSAEAMVLRYLAGFGPALRETAAMRRRMPDADLDTLAAALGVSRSAVNHRLRRLVELASSEED